MAEALRASVRYEAAYQRRLTRHKAQYPLDCEDGIEYSACLHELPRKFWSSRSGLSVFGTPSTPCRKSRAAGSMPTSFLAKALKRLPRPRVCMRSPSASLSSGAWNAWKKLFDFYCSLTWNWCKNVLLNRVDLSIVLQAEAATCSLCLFYTSVISSTLYSSS